MWPANVKQEERSIVLWWLIAAVAVWLCSGALIPLSWALSVAIGRWQKTRPRFRAWLPTKAAGYRDAQRARHMCGSSQGAYGASAA